MAAKAKKKSASHPKKKVENRQEQELQPFSGVEPMEGLKSLEQTLDSAAKAADKPAEEVPFSPTTEPKLASQPVTQDTPKAQTSSSSQDIITPSAQAATPSTDTSPEQPAETSSQTSQSPAESASQPQSSELAPLDATPASTTTQPQPEPSPDKAPKPPGETGQSPAQPATEADKAAKSETEPEAEASGSEDTEGSGGNKKTVMVILVIMLVILGVLGGVFYYVSTYGSSPLKKNEVKPSPAAVNPTQSPAASVEEVDVTKYTIQVLNGSGTPGEAGKVADKLKEAKFADIETGNAESYEYGETEVSIGKEAPEGLYTAIEEALSDEYVVTKAAEFRNVSSTFDAIIIVGSTAPGDEAEEEEEPVEE